MEDFEKKKTKIVNRIKGAMSLEDSFNAIREIQYVGQFFPWQITADLIEVKLVTLPCSCVSLTSMLGQLQVSCIKIFRLNYF